MDGSTGTVVSDCDGDANDKSGDCDTNRGWVVSLVPPSFVVELLISLSLSSTTMMRVVVLFCLDVGVDAGDNDVLQFDAAEG